MVPRIALIGIGTALPGPSIAQDQAAKVISRLTGVDEDWTTSLFHGTRIERRHFSLPPEAVVDALAGTSESGSPFVPHRDRPAGPSTAARMAVYASVAPRLATAAASSALADANVDSKSVTHLVTVSCTGFTAPGIDTALIRGLALPPTVERVQVGFMGCHAAVNGLRVVRGLLAAAPRTTAMLVAVELCSLHFDYRYGSAGMVPNALFADGAAAAILRSGTATEGWALTATGSCWWPDTDDAMTWRIGDNGFEMTLSSKVPSLIAQNLRPWLGHWLSERGLKFADIKSWVVHPGGTRILDMVEGSLELPSRAIEMSRRVLSEHGNMSSPTVLFILDRLRQHGATLPCVVLGFGPGLMAEAALLTD
ncbi:MAG: type III polyketide synthase [Gemmataceae bacterium]